MKYKRKISQRERWVLAVLPTVAILGIYLFEIYPGLSADADKAQKRLAAASGPAPRPVAVASPTKTLVADLKRKIADRLNDIPQLQDHINSVHDTQLKEEGDPALIIEKLEEACRRDHVTPVISESIIDSKSQAPQAIVSALEVDQTSDIGDGRTGQRVWHYIFDDTVDKLQKAVEDMTKDNITVVPLSMNLVYNPNNNGQTRLLEMWVLY